MIRAKNLVFRVSGRALIDHVDLALEAGKFIAILGPNGAGKSTLLKLLCGQLCPSAGHVEFDGRNLLDWPLRDLARRRAVLPQTSMVPFDFTALEIVLLGRSPHGDSNACLDMALEAMELTECRHLANRIVGTLSGGELQRVNLARVLVQIGLYSQQNSRVLMLDEPISNLDPAHQHGALRIARRLTGERTAVLVVLHDLNLAAQYADQIVLMNAGSIVACGGPSEVLQSHLINKVFSVKTVITENPISGTPAVFVDLND